MSDWNFDNPQIIEVKYEEIIGNETESFRRIFEHYQFHPQLLQRGLEIVEQFSLKNMIKSDTRHIRKGTKRQWTQEFSPLVRALFEETNRDLLIKLGY